MKRMFMLAAAASFLTSASAWAAPVTFFGQDLNGPPNNDPNQVAPTNSNAARNAFFGNLTGGVGTETFDTLPNGAGTPLAISFPGAGTATINGGGTVASGNDAFGRYPISGNQYYYTGTDNFSITFGSPIAAFGFYGVDLGDFGGQLTLSLTSTANVVTNLIVPYTQGSSGSTSGSILYFGFYDLATQYKSIAFSNNSSSDNFGFDSFSVGSITQVQPGVPEPSTWAMMLIGFAGLGYAGWRRRKSATA